MEYNVINNYNQQNIVLLKKLILKMASTYSAYFIDASTLSQNPFISKQNNSRLFMFNILLT